MENQAELDSMNDDFLLQPFAIDKEDLKCEDGKLIIKDGSTTDFEYQNCSENYIIPDDDKPNFFTRQFFYYYRMRADHFYPRIVEHGKEILGNSVKPIPLGEVRTNQKAFVIGCVLKRMKNRTAVLKDLEAETDEQVEIRMQKEDEIETLATDTDYLDFEDSCKQTVTLKGIDASDFVTGMVIGVYGIQDADNYFHVEKVILPSLPPYVDRPLVEKDVFIAIASGFNINDPCSSLLQELTYFANFFSSPNYYNNVARIIFAGNSSVTFCQCDNCLRTSINNVMPIGLTLDADKTNSALAASNNFRRNFAHIEIDIMPGENDPTSLFFPQQPLNKVLLEDYDFPKNDEEFEDETEKENFDQKAEIFDLKTEAVSESDDFGASDYWFAKNAEICPGIKRSINAVTNPYCFKIMGTEIHGTSGQNVDAFRKLTKKGKSTLEIMKDIIKSGIVVPTAPDFTDCFPFNRQDGIDPLALERLPHVFFAGNQKEFATEMADFGNGRMIRLISIPKFDESHSMILINLKNLQVSRIVAKK